MGKKQKREEQAAEEGGGNGSAAKKTKVASEAQGKTKVRGTGSCLEGSRTGLQPRLL